MEIVSKKLSELSSQEWKTIHDICYSCGSRSIKETYPYFRSAQHFSDAKSLCEIFDGVAFFILLKCKSHFRLLAIGVKSECQRCGYGVKLLMRMVQKMKAAGIQKLTFRTSLKEQGQFFWRGVGAQTVGKKGDDWEMELWAR